MTERGREKNTRHSVGGIKTTSDVAPSSQPQWEIKIEGNVAALPVQHKDGRLL